MMRALATASLVALFAQASLSRPDQVPDADLAAFKTWLDSTRVGYGCDEGPARFRNVTVDAAYPGRRYYYVLTYARGIPPPFRNATTVVAEVSGGRVRALRPASIDSYREGLKRVASDQAARRAAAAVLILSTCDPGERRWRFDPALFRVKHDQGGWICTYALAGPGYTSRVVFDREGMLASVEAKAPPVP